MPRLRSASRGRRLFPGGDSSRVVKQEDMWKIRICMNQASAAGRGLLCLKAAVCVLVAGDPGLCEENKPPRYAPADRSLAASTEADESGSPPGLADVKRDDNGQVRSLTLPESRVNDEALVLASGIPSIRELRVRGRARAVNGFEPTQKWFAALVGMTNLVSLRVDCMGEMDGGMFREITKLKSLHALSLYGAFPRREEYAGLTNLQGLLELHVSYCTNFGDAELVVLTNLTHLRSISLYATAVSSNAPKIVGQMKGVTNVVIRP